MNKTQKIIIFLIVILIILLIAILIAINSIKDKEHGDYEVMGKDFSNTVNSLSITNLSILNEFFGNDSDKGIAIAKKYRNLFTIEIPKIQKELKNYENISEYYNIEKNEIINNYFNIDETNFINLCTKINLMTSNLENDYNNCSFAFNEDKSIVIITCTYKNGESISLEMDSDEKISVK